MHKLRFLFLILLVACAHNSTPIDIDDTYYLDGKYRQDGMIATLSLSGGYLLVVNERYSLRSCVSPGYSRCYATDYFTFAYPDEPRPFWSVAGVAFRHTGVKTVTIHGVPRSVELIESPQGAGKFLFYYSPTVGIVGWDMSYVGSSGKTDTVRFFMRQRD